MNVAFLFSMLFQNTDSKTQHILFFCLSKGNLHELRKRRNYVGSSQSHQSLYKPYLQMRKNNRISMDLIPKSSLHFPKHSWRKKRVQWNEFWAKNQSSKLSHGPITVRFEQITSSWLQILIQMKNQISEIPASTKSILNLRT